VGSRSISRWGTRTCDRLGERSTLPLAPASPISVRMSRARRVGERFPDSVGNPGRPDHGRAAVVSPPSPRCHTDHWSSVMRHPGLARLSTARYRRPMTASQHVVERGTGGGGRRPRRRSSDTARPVGRLTGRGMGRGSTRDDRGGTGGWSSTKTDPVSGDAGLALVPLGRSIGARDRPHPSDVATTTRGAAGAWTHARRSNEPARPSGPPRTGTPMVRRSGGTRRDRPAMMDERSGAHRSGWALAPSERLGVTESWPCVPRA